MSQERDTEETPVIFRKFGKNDGYAVIALFPTIPDAYSGPSFGSYMHVGQHSGCNPDIVSITKLATPEEYEDLKRELESEPYGYRLKVCRRISRHHRKAHSDAQRDLRRVR